MPYFCSHLSRFNHSLHTNPDFTNYYLSLLRFCRKSRDLEALKSLLIVHGLISHQPLVKHFIDQCCHLGFPNLALSAFRTIEKPSLYLQNLVLRSLSSDGLFEDVMYFYQTCRDSGLSSDNYSYPFVIKASAALRDVWFGKMMHCVVLKSGFGKNLVVQTALLDFYSKVGEMGNARKLVDEISQPDVVVWNALISGYSVNGFDYEVLQVFQDMHTMSVKPNSSTFASVFPVCSRVGVDDVGTSVHGLAYKLGYTEEESLVPALISMYANIGDLLAARHIFDTSTRNNVAIWNAITSAYTRNHRPEDAVPVFQAMLRDDMKPNMITFVSLLPSSENLGCIYVESFHAYLVKFGFEEELSVVTALLSVIWWQQSLEAFHLMQKDGFVPDAISIVSLLSSCSEISATLLGKSAHAFSIRKGIDLNLNASNALLAFYCDSKELVYSFRIFDRIVDKNVVSWNTMISGCVDNGESERAMLLFHQMRQGGLDFDMVTLITILPSCHECQNPLLGLAIHSYALKTALTTDISLVNALVSMYINCGELDAARLLFDDMPDKTVVSWNAVLTGYRFHNLQKETIELFNQMIEEGQTPNYVTLLNVLPACHTLPQGKSIHGYIIRRMIPLETPLLTSLMIMYARLENLTSWLKLFHIGDKTSISLWNTVISANLLSKDGSMAFSFFRELLRNKIEPDDVTVLNLISACVHLKNLHISNSVLGYLVRKGFDKHVAISNALIDMYAKCGNISCARMLFEALAQKDAISWSVTINGYGLHGDVEAALALYTQMKLLGLKPDKATYLSVLSACSHGGFVEQGRKIFDSMIHEDGVYPGLEHYACMVDLIGRTGHLDEAYELVKNLPHKPSSNILGSLLGACLSHGNYQLGEEIGRLLLDMNPKDSGSYVILHNIYAAAGKWLDANNVRVAMEQNQFSKSPGVSLLDGNTCIL
ncbi:UNVERIFIED_CONTAM: Pentatricopeptide repeat-containing protein, mitochondrial [Sesamum latifolium]|uniref:Pentatricopeptide repeat-containing protein, mitochondrial n=1 Tax=Sesamum latifolium TaxID=2727402 RepID=A0AAW2XDW6_9LAMI